MTRSENKEWTSTKLIKVSILFRKNKNISVDSATFTYTAFKQFAPGPFNSSSGFF